MASSYYSYLDIKVTYLVLEKLSTNRFTRLFCVLDTDTTLTCNMILSPYCNIEQRRAARRSTLVNSDDVDGQGSS